MAGYITIHETSFTPNIRGLAEEHFPGGGGGYSRKFWIRVCRQGSSTLTLFKEKGSENWYPI